MSDAAVTMPYARASQRSRFSAEGFLALDSFTSLDDIARIRSLLDPLFDRFDSIGDRAADLAGPRAAGTPLRTPEINDTSVLVPELRRTETFERCRRLAHSLLGKPVCHVFDHAIYKPPHNLAATGWHQDEVYSKSVVPLRSIHFWIPLQAATLENGCMWYIPGSHLHGLVPHRAAAIRTAGSSPHKVGTTFVVDSVDTSKAVICPIPAGGATLHHSRTLHYAGPNESDDYRRAWILHFGPYGKWRYRLHPKNVQAKIRALLTQTRFAR